MGTRVFKAIHHLLGVSGSRRNDQIGLQGEDPLKIQTDIASHLDLCLGLFREVAMDGDAHDLLSRPKLKRISVILGARETILFGGGGEDDLPSDFIHEF